MILPTELQQHHLLQISAEPQFLHHILLLQDILLPNHIQIWIGSNFFLHLSPHVKNLIKYLLH